MHRLLFEPLIRRETMKRKMKTAFLVLILLLFVGQVYAKSIRVTSPAAGDVWHRGQTHTIIWAKTGSMEANVKLRIFNSNATAIIEPIIDDVPNNGAFSWTVPSFLTPGNYIIRVRTTDNEVTGDSAVFTVADFKSSLPKVVIYPDSNSSLCVVQSCDIRWLQGSVIDSVIKLELFNVVSPATVFPIAASTNNDGSHFWLVPTTIQPGNYSIRILSMDNRQLGDSAAFQLKSCDGAVIPELKVLKQMITGIKEIQLQRDPMGPVGHDTAPLVFDLRRIKEICRQAGLKSPVVFELVGANGMVVELGVFGPNNDLGNAMDLRKLNPHQRGPLQNNTHYNLVIKNEAGKILHVQPMLVRE